MIISDKIISISEFRKSISKYLNKVRKTKKPLFLFQNNKPVGVILDIEEYERLFVEDNGEKDVIMLYPLSDDEVPQSAKKEYKKLLDKNGKVDFTKLKDWEDVMDEI